jgi:hypothetical protein
VVPLFLLKIPPLKRGGTSRGRKNVASGVARRARARGQPGVSGNGCSRSSSRSMQVASASASSLRRQLVLSCARE